VAEPKRGWSFRQQRSGLPATKRILSADRPFVALIAVVDSSLSPRWSGLMQIFYCIILMLLFVAALANSSMKILQ